MLRPQLLLRGGAAWRPAALGRPSRVDGGLRALAAGSREPRGRGRGKRAAFLEPWPAEAPSKDRCDEMHTDLRQEIGQYGHINKKTMGIRRIYTMLRVSKGAMSYNQCLSAINMFYNFGVKLDHPELASRVFAAAMVSKPVEAVELLRLNRAWLEHPPALPLVYSAMSHFLEAGELLTVRDMAKSVREDWRMDLEPALYILSIEAMLRLPEDALAEALTLYKDAQLMRVCLPESVHVRLLSAHLAAFEEEEDFEHLRGAVHVAEEMTSNLHVGGGPSAAVMCSLAWTYRYLELPAASGVPHGGVQGDWRDALNEAMLNFGCDWGFSANLPAGFFRSLEASDDPKTKELLVQARHRFGRFYPE